MSLMKMMDVVDPRLGKSRGDYEDFYKKVELLAALVNSNIPELQDQIYKLRKITEKVEDIHKLSTAGSLSGGLVAAAGGIAAVAGFALAPFTLGASLVVAEIGAVAAVTGGVTSAAFNTLNMIHQKVSRNDIEKAVKIFKKRLAPITECLEDIQLKLQRMPSQSVDVLCARVGRMMLGEMAEILGSSMFQLSRTLRTAGAVMAVLSSVLVVLDIFFIVSDINELRELENPPSSSDVKSNTVKFLQKMKEAIKTLKQAVEDITSINKMLQRLPPPSLAYK